MTETTLSKDREQVQRIPQTRLSELRRRLNLPVWGDILVQLGLIVGAFAVVIVANILLVTGDSATLVVGGVLGAIIAVWVVLRPQIGLYLLTIFTYLNLSDVLEVSFGIPKINQPLVALIFLSVLANRIVLNRKPFIFRGVEASMALYGVVIIFSVIFAQVNQDSALDRLIDWLKDFAVLIIIVQLCDEEQPFKILVWSLIFSASFLSVLSWYQTLTGDIENTFWGLANVGINQITEEFDSARVTGPLVDPNFYAQILIMVFPMALYRAFTGEKTSIRLLGTICTILIGGTIVFTYSRGGLLGLVVVLALSVFDRRYKFVKVAFVSVLGFGLVAPFLPPGYLDRVNTLFDFLPGSGDAAIQEDSFRGRSSEMTIAMQMFTDNPFLGVGRSNYKELYLQYSALLGLDMRLENRQAHSLYLEMAAEMGLLGLISFSIMMLVLFVSSFRARAIFMRLNRPDLDAWTAGVQWGMIGFLTTSIFLHADYTRYMWLLFAVVAGTSVLATTMLQKQREADSSGRMLSQLNSTQTQTIVTPPLTGGAS